MADGARHARLMAYFDELCDLSIEDRSERIASLRSQDEAMAAALVELLSADDRSAFLDREPEGGAARILASDLAGGLDDAEPIPAELGDYRILRRIGAGGMGTVYEAEQAHPARRVALKTIHPWMMTPRAEARFRFEAGALAQLEHRHIPRVFAAGEAAGLHYLAMELVRGPTLGEWAVSSPRSRSSIVEMLALIAEAVHHAHQRGYVHLDLKPDNVRIAADGSPRVLDFGIARAIGEVPSDREISGTLSFMSPEQLSTRYAPDVRSDVYALGCMGFKLLSGRLPHELAGLEPQEAIRRVREDAPAWLAEIAPSAPPELASIVAKAIAREPDDRYGTAAELAQDLRRHLRGDAVLAHAGGAIYRWGKALRKHAFAFGAAASIVAALIAGGAASFVSFRRAERALGTALAEGNKAEATVEFLLQLLAEAHPHRSMGEPLTVREAVDRAARRVDQGALGDQPEVEAGVRRALAETYIGLGDEQAGLAQADQVRQMVEAGRLPEGIELARALLYAAEVEFQAGLLDRAADDAERAIEIARKRSDPIGEVQLAESLHVAGVVARERGDLDRAERLLREALANKRELYRSGVLGEDLLTNSMNQLGHVLAYRGNYPPAEALYQEALERDQRRHGPDHPEVATDLHNLAWLLKESERPAAALPLLARARKIRERTLGASHKRLGVQGHLEAEVYLALGRNEDAEVALDRALKILAAAYGEGNGLHLALSTTQIAVLSARGQHDRAIELGRRLCGQIDLAFGPAHGNSAACSFELGRALAAAGSDEAATWFSRAARIAAQGGARSALIRAIELASAGEARGEPGAGAAP